MAEKNKDKSEDSSMDKMYEIFSKLLEQQQQQQVKVSPEAVKYALEPNPVKLSGPANYVSWARHAQLILSSHGYENFLIGDDEKQKDGHVYTKQNNDRVLVWLLGSMEPIVRQQVEIMQTVYEVWSTLEKQFAGKSNKMQATRIMDELTHLKQGTKSETEYSGVAKRLYRDLHYFHPFEPVDKQDIAVHHKWFESLVAKFVPVLAPTSGESRISNNTPSQGEDYTAGDNDNGFHDPETASGLSLPASRAGIVVEDDKAKTARLFSLQRKERRRNEMKKIQM